MSDEHTNQIYLAEDAALPGYVGTTWCERIHLAVDDLGIGIDPETGAPSPMICLKEKGGFSSIAIPTFAFDDHGNVIPYRLEQFAAHWEETWIWPQLLNAIHASINNYGEKPLFAYLVTSDAWPKRVGICVAEHECEPVAHDYTIEAILPEEAEFGHRPVERPVFHDHLIAR